MKRAVFERNLVVFLFVLVLVVFSFAERDSRKLKQVYNTTVLLKKSSNATLARLNIELNSQQ